MDTHYTSYKDALVSCDILSLKERRKVIFERFSMKTYSNSKFSKWFQPNITKKINIITRNPKLTLKPVPTCTKQFSSSAIPSMTEVINHITV